MSSSKDTAFVDGITLSSTEDSKRATDPYQLGASSPTIRYQAGTLLITSWNLDLANSSTRNGPRVPLFVSLTQAVTAKSTKSSIWTNGTDSLTVKLIDASSHCHDKLK